jgi:perosamine synthetase
MVKQFGFKPGDFPITEYISARTLALPFFTRMTETQVDLVCQTLERVLENRLMAKKSRF